MTVDRVKEFVAAVEKVRDDDEAAHCLESRLYRCLVRAIASGQCTDPVACCKEAIRTQEMDFARWKA